MIVVVQDIGTDAQNVRLTIDSEAVAHDFAAGMRDQFPESTFTVRPAADVISYSTPHQVGEEYPLSSDL